MLREFPDFTFSWRMVVGNLSVCNFGNKDSFAF